MIKIMCGGIFIHARQNNKRRVVIARMLRNSADVVKYGSGEHPAEAMA
jgi:hypothetical protein